MGAAPKPDTYTFAHRCGKAMAAGRFPLIWTSPARHAIAFGFQTGRGRGLFLSATTDSGGRGLALMERLLDSLTDPARRERSVAVALLCYVALWTLYGMLAKASQDIHVDMSEQFALARELALGYPKHPPLTMAVVRAWFAVFPAADWAYYLLAMANIGLTLWIVWRLMARFVDGEKRVVGLALLTLVPFFNFHALKFNVNTVLMPLWAATTLWFLRSFETRRPLDAALAGLAAAASMYGKYWSVFLLIGLALAALADPRRAAYFRSAAPWVTVAVGALGLAPHGARLVANEFAPFSYAVVVHGASSFFRPWGRSAAISPAASAMSRSPSSSSPLQRVPWARPSGTWPGQRSPSVGWRRWHSGPYCSRRRW